MKLELVTHTCKQCRHVFDAPHLLCSFLYGEFLMRSKNNELAYLRGLEDPTFDEVDRILSTIPPVATMDDKGKAKVLHRIYGEVACDPDSSGAAFRIEGYPTCPVCGCGEEGGWKVKQPHEFVDVEAPLVTHRHWDALGEQEKAEAVRKAVEGIS